METDTLAPPARSGPTALELEAQREAERAAAPAPEVRSPEDVHAEMIEAAQAEASSDALHVEFGGERFTARKHRPAGAFAVMCARLKSSNPGTQTAAPIQLLMAWIVEEEHERLLEAIGEVDDLEEWMGGEFRVAMEALAQRPSQAP